MTSPNTRIYVGGVGAARGERRARSFDGELRMRGVNRKVISIPIALVSKREHNLASYNVTITFLLIFLYPP